MANKYNDIKVIPRQEEIRKPIKVATSQTPKDIVSDIATNTVEQPIKVIPRQETVQQPLQTPTPTGAGQQAYSPPKLQEERQIRTAQAPSTVTDVQPNIPLRQTLEGQGIKVDYDPQTRQVTANGIPVDTTRMNLVNGSYQASQEDINNIMNVVTEQQKMAQQEIKKPTKEEMPATIEDVEQNYMQRLDDLNKRYEERTAQLEEGLSNFKSSYDKEIIDTLREAYGNPFEYDPNADPSLQEAQRYAERQIVDAMNARGILNSTITRDQYASALSGLIPQYEKIAFEKYQQNINNQLKRVDVLQSLSKQDYDRYTDYIDMAITSLDKITASSMDTLKDNYNIMYEQAYKRPMELRNQAIKEEEKSLNMAYDKLKNQGYVDNEIASITGLRPGMLSFEASKELDGYQLSLQEQSALLNNEITMNDIRHNAKLQEIESQKAEVQTIESAKNYMNQIEAYMNTLSADQAKRFWNENYNTMIEELGDSYVYVTEDANRINESLSKRAMDERKQGLQEREFGLAQQKESRLAQTEKEEKSSIGISTAKSEVDKFIKAKEYESMDSVQAVSEIADKIDLLPISDKQKSDLKLLYLGGSASGDERNIDDITMTQNYSRYASIYDDALSDSLSESQEFAGATLQGMNKTDIYKEIKDNKETYIEELGEYYYNALLNRYR